jgi:hypothetical protein
MSLKFNITGREKWTRLARKKDWWRAVVITVLNLQSVKFREFFYWLKKHRFLNKEQVPYCRLLNKFFMFFLSVLM